MAGKLVISLDFELLWGVRDHATRETYGKEVLGARRAIPQILDLFSEHDISATWATVGFLFCKNRDELLASAAKILPSYTQSNLSNYTYFDEVGTDESTDPYYFAFSLIDQISSTPRQEIATHTMSHYYCLESGQTNEQFEADIDAAIAIAKKRSINLRSIVFPRNQYNDKHIQICKTRGLNVYRGNQNGWAYEPTSKSGQNLARRGIRLIDAYTGLTGAHDFHAKTGYEIDIPASQFLRPASGRLAKLHGLHISAVCRNMTIAAKRGRNFHLWWHPHNFGINTNDNLIGLRQILDKFSKLKETYGMSSSTMSDFMDGKP